MLFEHVDYILELIERKQSYSTSFTFLIKIFSSESKIINQPPVTTIYNVWDRCSDFDETKKVIKKLQLLPVTENAYNNVYVILHF